MSITSSNTIQDLRDHPALWYRVHVFIYDLRKFREFPEAQARLDSIMDSSYIGLPYFTPDEAEQIKTTIIYDDKTLQTVIEETLRERLERRMKKRTESGDYRVCAAHDIAPIFEKAFGIDPQALAKNQEFLALVDRSGLKLKEGENWKGLPKKSFQKKKKGKKGR